VLVLGLRDLVKGHRPVGENGHADAPEEDWAFNQLPKAFGLTTATLKSISEW
jgi:hypothetical protein